MPIENEEELKVAVDKASNLMQEIQDYVGRNKSENGKITFPRGYLTKVSEYRKLISCVDEKSTKANISYTLMAIDVLRWIVTKTDLSGIPAEMIFKIVLTLQASICEVLTIRKGEVGLGKNKNTFEQRTERLCELEVIDRKLADDLKWLWKQRVKIHLYKLDEPEFAKYDRSDPNRARKTTSALIKSLNRAYSKK